MCVLRAIEFPYAFAQFALGGPKPIEPPRVGFGVLTVILEFTTHDRFCIFRKRASSLAPYIPNSIIEII
ncbi:hypothetical protein BWQ93_10080 [Sphingopyxis sp. QXT-31]|nr:hypothetical protein BWQ93_10080 [Sphingopyxis sp. QXT-31]